MSDEDQIDVDAGAKAAQRHQTEQRWMRFAAVVIVVVVFAAFVLDNSQSVRVGFLFFEQNTPLIWVLLVTALAGAAIDRLIRWRRHS